MAWHETENNSNRRRVSAEKLGEAIKEELMHERRLTEESLKTAIDQTAKEVLSKTKSRAPVKTGDYKKGWTSKVTLKPGRGGYGKTVYDKKYKLTHLLQHGHGGPQPAPAHPHIMEDEETEALLIKNIESEMAKG